MKEYHQLGFIQASTAFHELLLDSSMFHWSQLNAIELAYAQRPTNNWSC